MLKPPLKIVRGATAVGNAVKLPTRPVLGSISSGYHVTGWAVGLTFN